MHHLAHARTDVSASLQAKQTAVLILLLIFLSFAFHLFLSPKGAIKEQGCVSQITGPTAVIRAHQAESQCDTIVMQTMHNASRPKNQLIIYIYVSFEGCF